MYSIMKADASVRPRIRIERQIVRATVKALLEAGYWLAVNDGEEVCKASNKATFLRHYLMETDEDWLVVISNLTECKCGRAILASEASNVHDGLYCPHCGACLTYGWVRFVYGNDGWDVICDYTVNLEAVIGDGTAVDKLITKYMG